MHRQTSIIRRAIPALNWSCRSPTTGQASARFPLPGSIDPPARAPPDLPGPGHVTVTSLVYPKPRAWRLFLSNRTMLPYDHPTALTRRSLRAPPTTEPRRQATQARAVPGFLRSTCQPWPRKAFLRHRVPTFHSASIRPWPCRRTYAFLSGTGRVCPCPGRLARLCLPDPCLGAST
jgi:hypothetical protein